MVKGARRPLELREQVDRAVPAVIWFAFTTGPLEADQLGTQGAKQPGVEYLVPYSVLKFTSFLSHSPCSHPQRPYHPFPHQAQPPRAPP